MKTSLLARRLGLFVALYARGAENLVSFVSRFGSDVVVVLLAQADKASIACATTMRDVRGARSSDGSVHLRPGRAARRRLEPVLVHSARQHPSRSVNKHHAARRDAYGGTRDG
jgi:hypothetical protein